MTQMTLDPSSGRYRGMICLEVTVESEFYLRELQRLIAESPGLDYSLPGTMETLRKKLADPLYWRGKPQSKEQDLSLSPTPPLGGGKEPEPGEKPQAAAAKGKGKGKGTQVPSMRWVLWEKAQYLPLHRWEAELQSPAPSPGPKTKEKQAIHNRRSRERELLGRLRDDVKAGRLTLSPEAQAQEEEYQQAQQQKVQAQSKALALLTNTSRLDRNFVAATNESH